MKIHMEATMTKIKEKLFGNGSFFEVFKYKDLLYQLVSRDIKLKYRRSFLGYVWSILNPLLIMTIMSIVFSFLFHRKLEFFPLYLLAGRSMFEFVDGSAKKTLSSITDNTSLLKKTYVSKFMFPLAKITAGMVDFVFSLGALVIVMVFYSFASGRVLFSFWNLGIVITVIEAYVFALGLGLLLAQLNVFFRDIRYIYNAISTMWLYCSAIFYDIGMLYERAAKEPLAGVLARIIDNCNPIYIYIKQFRYFIWVPTLSEKIPNWAMINQWDFIFGFGYAILMFAIGVFFFKKSQDKFILYI